LCEGGSCCIVALTGGLVRRLAGLSEERVSVLLRGAVNVNRAIDGDVVAVEILPRRLWLRPAEVEAEATPAEEGEGEAKGAEGEDDDGEGATSYEDVIPEPTAAPTVEDITNVKGAGEGDLRPTGRVVGIIKRNWRVYCGTLQASADKLSGGGGSTSALFVPVEKRIPKVRIQTERPWQSSY
jgi:exosome complex exonuclease DIS3/RRP44